MDINALHVRLLEILNYAKVESPDALADTKKVINDFFYALSAKGGFPEQVGEANVSPALRARLEEFLADLQENEDEIADDEENIIPVVNQVTASVVAGRRKSKTRKHLKRRKHTRKHYRPKGKKL